MVIQRILFKQSDGLIMEIPDGYSFSYDLFDGMIFCEYRSQVSETAKCRSIFQSS